MNTCRSSPSAQKAQSSCRICHLRGEKLLHSTTFTEEGDRLAEAETRERDSRDQDLPSQGEAHSGAAGSCPRDFMKLNATFQKCTLRLSG